MKMKLIAFVGLALTVFAACSNTPNETKTDAAATTTATTEKAPAAIAKSLPSFKVMGMDGNSMNLADLKGKKVFVNLWATWCPPCKKEIPSIESLYSKVDKQKTVFVMLSLDDNFDVAKQYVTNNKIQVPVYYPTEKLPAIFNTDGIPVTFIFNEKGELIKVNNGMEDYDTKTYLRMLN
ncbi:MAG TPA: TlpA disulfide reductase family protein [Hanamia sp.]